MRLRWKTLAKWQEPREATRWRTEVESQAASPWIKIAVAALYAGLILLVWRNSRSPEKPSVGNAFLLAVGSAFFFTVVVPRLTRLAPVRIWVRDYGIHWAHANTARILRYADITRVRIGPLSGGPPVPFLSVLLRSGRWQHLGVAPQIDLMELEQALAGAGIAVQMEQEPTP